MQRAVWEKIVYMLIYPAVLGSMIYDFTDLVTFGPQPTFQKISLFLIVGIYLADFATNKGITSDRPEDQNTPWGMAVDTLVAVGLRYAYSYVEVNDYQTSLGIMFALTELFFFYNIWKHKEIEFAPQFIIVSVIIGGMLLYQRLSSGENALLILVAAQIVMIGAYLLYARAQKKSTA